MRVWQSATLSLFLLTVVHASPLSRTRRSASRRARAAATDGLLHSPVPDHAPDQTSTHGNTDTTDLEEMSETKEFNMADLHPDQFEDVVDFIKVTISRIRRSSGPGVRRKRRERKKKKEGGEGGREVRLNPKGGRRGGGGGGKRGGGCALKQIHMNVSDLGLGFQTSEEMIFSYCSGPCRTSENNYDKILSNLSQRRKLPRDTPPHACCRPIAFDDDLSFLDDNLIYHTMKRHSARKCGCV